MIPAGIPHDLTFAHREVLYLLAVPAVVLLWGLINARELRRVFAPLMRAIVLALFIVALANPQQVMHSEGAARPALVDASASITPAMRAWTLKLLHDDLGLRAGDPAYMFATSAAPQSIGSIESAFADGTGCAECGPGATNLEAALYRIAADPDAHGGPAVMVTDGWQNRGDAERAISAIVNAGIRLDIFTPPGARSIPNVAMTALSLPPALEKAAPFALGVTMENLNDAPVTGTIAIERDGALIDQRKVTLQRGSQRFDFPVRTETAGLASYSATYKPDNPALRRVPRRRLAQGMGRRGHAAQSSDSHRQRQGRELSRHRRQSDGTRADCGAGYRRRVGRHRRGLRRGADQQRAERADRAGRAECDGAVRQPRRLARDDRWRFELRSWRLCGQSARRR